MMIGLKLPSSRIPILARWLGPAGPVLLVVGINAWLAARLARIEYLPYLSSIEGAYIGLADWIARHPWDWRWFPLWYGGIPFQNSYPPLLHFLTAGVIRITGLSAASAYHAVTAATYIAGPLCLYWLLRQLGCERLPATVAATFYSVASPSAWLFKAVAADLGTPWGARRLHTLVYWGEGPHVASLTLLALALAVLAATLNRRTPLKLLLAACLAAAVALTNWIGGFSLAVFALAYLLAWGAGLRDWLYATLIGLCAYGLAAPWIPPSTIQAIRWNAQHTVGSYPLARWHFAVAVVVLAAAATLALVLARWRVPPLLRFGLLATTLFAVIVCPSYLGHVYLIPQPERYHLELELALAITVGAGASVAASSWGNRARVVLLIFTLALVVLAWPVQRAARKWIRPGDVTQSVEYQIGRWLAQHRPEERVFVQGSTRFWLTAFGGVPQLGGGFDQGLTNRLLPHILYGVPNDPDPYRALIWLRALGVGTLVVNVRGGGSALADFPRPGEYARFLPKLWGTELDGIYAIPRRSSSLAHIIPAQAAVSQPVRSYLDADPLKPYVAALEDPTLPLVQFQWLAPHRARIRGSSQPGQLLSVQVSYDPGWEAYSKGQRLQLEKDGLGQILIHPPHPGPWEIEMTYTGGREALLARMGFFAALLGPAIAAIWRARRSWALASEGPPGTKDSSFWR